MEARDQGYGAKKEGALMTLGWDVFVLFLLLTHQLRNSRTCNLFFFRVSGFLPMYRL